MKPGNWDDALEIGGCLAAPSCLGLITKDEGVDLYFKIINGKGLEHENGN